MKFFDEELKDVPNKPVLSQKEVKNIISSLKVQTVDYIKTVQPNSIVINEKLELSGTKSWTKPIDIRKYDVVALSIGNMYLRPAIVFKIDRKRDVCAVVPFSTTEGSYCLEKIQSSRFHQDSWMCNNIHILKIEEARAAYTSTFDNKKEADRLFNLLKQFYKKLL